MIDLEGVPSCLKSERYKMLKIGAVLEKFIWWGRREKNTRPIFQVARQHWLKITTLCIAADKIKVKSKESKGKKMKTKGEKQKAECASSSGQK